MNDYGFLSVVPPLLTIFVALYSKNVLLALVCGILSGSLIIADFNPFYALIDTVENHVLKEVSSGAQVQVILIMFIIGGFVKLLEVSGGASAFASKLTSLVTSRAKAQLLVWFSGLAIFFTDSGNSLIVGPLYRPVFDRFKLCREKLAYIIDTTSSPISILIPFIGWGAYITALIEKSYTEIGLDENAFSVLIKVIPYQFYAFLALATVPILIILGKDYGPMLSSQQAVERNSAANSAASSAGNNATNNESSSSDGLIKEPFVNNTTAVSGPQDKVGLFLYPLGVMLLLVGGLITWHATHGGLSSVHIRSTLAIAYLTASLTCMEMMRRHQSKSYNESLGVFIKGAESLVYISIVLVLAWSLSSVTKDLHTANYLASIFVGRIEPMYFPMIVFALGAVISLSTGSSYGTFAILMSIAIPVGYELGASMYLCIAAVLSGGLFGDHVSPISDTTVLASAGAECEHLSHVTTQGAYAVVTGLVALLAYGFAGAYESVYVLPVAICLLFVALYILMKLFGKRL
jgi:Na+/H+ antiporter NhaC